MPRPKEHVVALTGDDRAELTRVVSRGTHPARMITRARILLALDESELPAPDRRVVAERAGVSTNTVYLVAKRFTETGGRVDAVIGRRQAGHAAGAGEGDRRCRGPGDRAGVHETPAGLRRGGRCGCWRNMCS